MYEQQGEQVEEGDNNKQNRPKLQSGWGGKKTVAKGKVLVPFSVPQVPVGAGEISPGKITPTSSTNPKENAWSQGVGGVCGGGTLLDHIDIMDTDVSASFY